MSCIGDLAGKLAKKADQVLDLSGGTSHTKKACILFEQSRKLSGCDFDSGILNAAKPRPSFNICFASAEPEVGYYER